MPASGGLVRQTKQPMVLDGYQVPAGTNVLMQQAPMSRLYYPKPDQFLPERWIRGYDDPIAKENPAYGLLMFGFGRRQCVGRELALVGDALMEARFVSNFQI